VIGRWNYDLTIRRADHVVEENKKPKFFGFEHQMVMKRGNGKSLCYSAFRTDDGSVFCYRVVMRTGDKCGC
jgi:hypothetical protein